jgi:cytochrome c biogenesis protein CcdA
MAIATLGLAMLAGLLSILSPCVLPLLPVVLGAAASEHRFGPLALAGGLAVSFTAIGLFVATIGFAIGLDGEFFRALSAVLLITVGAVLLAPALQARLAVAAGPLGNWTERQFGGGPATGLAGQFGVGALLGAVWVPCVGPTIGAASLLAAQGENLGEVAATMLLFGFGAGVPLALLGFLSREVLMGWRERMSAAGRALKLALGAILIGTGFLILSGFDKQIEAALLEAAPEWLLDLTTRF